MRHCMNLYGQMKSRERQGATILRLEVAGWVREWEAMDLTLTQICSKTKLTQIGF